MKYFKFATVVQNMEWHWKLLSIEGIIYLSPLMDYNDCRQLDLTFFVGKSRAFELSFSTWKYKKG